MAKTNHWGAGSSGGDVSGSWVACADKWVAPRAGPAEATFPGKNGRIAYNTALTRCVIYTINPGGGGKTKVTMGDTFLLT